MDDSLGVRFVWDYAVGARAGRASSFDDDLSGYERERRRELLSSSVQVGEDLVLLRIVNSKTEGDDSVGVEAHLAKCSRLA